MFCEEDFQMLFNIRTKVGQVSRWVFGTSIWYNRLLFKILLDHIFQGNWLHGVNAKIFLVIFVLRNLTFLKESSNFFNVCIVIGVEKLVY